MKDVCEREGGPRTCARVSERSMDSSERPAYFRLGSGPYVEAGPRPYKSRAKIHDETKS
jgi:hypothetical protein